MVTYMRDALPVGTTITSMLWNIKRHKGMKDISDCVIEGITRKAKYIILHLNDGILLCHNKFTGYWSLDIKPWTFDYLEYDRKPGPKDIRATFNVMGPDGTHGLLEYHDARLLGELEFFKGTKDPTLIERLNHLGPDVVETPTLTPAFRNTLWDFCAFQHAMKTTGQPIKLALLDQRRQAGIGNIYACEALWRASINPFGKAKDCKSLHPLYTAIKEVMSEALSHKVDYDKYIKVFRRDKCERCNTAITRSEQANRGTYWCQVCQVR